MTGAVVAGVLVAVAVLLAGGPEGRVAQVVPPLAISERRLHQALDRRPAVGLDRLSARLVGRLAAGPSQHLPAMRWTISNEPHCKYRIMAIYAPGVLL